MQTMSLNAPYTSNTIIQSSLVSNDLIGLGNGSNDTTNNSMSTFRGEATFDFVASGCVWSGDSYGVSRNASMTSGVVYIGGTRLALTNVAGRAFTASKDTYIDSNSSGVPVYTEVTNNAASPALAASSLRIGIVVTGATTIAAAGSVNQGQESAVLPIASSIAYSVTDSLGNLICSRDPMRRTIGYRQITVQITTASATNVQAVGLSAAVIIPTNRKVRITIGFIGIGNTTSGQACAVNIWSGVVTSGTQLQELTYVSTGAGTQIPVFGGANDSASSGSVTYNVGYRASANTAAIGAGANTPSWLRVELEN